MAGQMEEAAPTEKMKRNEKTPAYKNRRPYFKRTKAKKPLAERFFRYKQIRFLYNHFFRYVLALIPRLQYSEYGTPQTGEKWVVIWFSWMGHVFWDKRYLLDPEDRSF